MTDERRIIDDPKCRKCGGTLGPKGLRSMKAKDRPDDIIKKGGKFYHERCA